MTAIRAVHLVRPDPSAQGGGDLNQLHSTCRALQELGIDASSASWGTAPSEVDIVHLYNLWLPFALNRDVRRARRRWPKAKIVVAPIFWTWPSWAVLRSGDRRLIRLVSRSQLKTWASWALCRRVLRTVDAVLPMSSAESDVVANYFRVKPDQRWTVVPNGIWVEDWPYRRAYEKSPVLTKFGLPSDIRSVVACIAAIHPNKNQRNVARAAASLPDRALLLIGAKVDVPYAESIFKLADRLMPGRWAWAGRLDQPQLRDALSAVDTSVLASYREPVGLASLEAAASGCEVVVSDLGSTREYFGDTAHFCRPERPDSIAAAIERASSNPRQPSTRARVEPLTWSATGQAVATVYRWLLDA